MSVLPAKIFDHLQSVEAERRRREATLGLLAKVNAIKIYQQQRFTLTYSDLLASERYGPAAQFFLAELYGPADFSARDAQFARVIPALVRLFPGDVVESVAGLAELHALSESLDTAMGLALSAPMLDATSYVLAWQLSGNLQSRMRQIELTIQLGQSLDRLTRKPLLRSGLRLMRRPAAAAGLGQLQDLLESGFDAFLAMHGAQEFLATVEFRERRLASELFTAILNDSEPVNLVAGRFGLP